MYGDKKDKNPFLWRNALGEAMLCMHIGKKMTWLPTSSVSVPFTARLCGGKSWFLPRVPPRVPKTPARSQVRGLLNFKAIDGVNPIEVGVAVQASALFGWAVIGFQALFQKSLIS